METDRALTQQEKELVDSLSQAQLSKVDEVLIGHADPERFRKVAYIIAIAMADLPDFADDLPDIFFSQRITYLVETGFLESQGKLNAMRYCEVRRVR